MEFLGHILMIIMRGHEMGQKLVDAEEHTIAAKACMIHV